MMNMTAADPAAKAQRPRATPAWRDEIEGPALTKRGSARRWKVSVSRIERLCRAGTIESFQIGASIRVVTASLDAHFEGLIEQARAKRAEAAA